MSARDYAKEAEYLMRQTLECKTDEGATIAQRMAVSLALLAIHGELRRIADAAEPMDRRMGPEQPAPAPLDLDLIERALTAAGSYMDSDHSRRAVWTDAVAEVRRARRTP